MKVKIAYLERVYKNKKKVLSSSLHEFSNNTI